MLQKYMGNVTQLYGKCVKYYMGSVLLGSDTQPTDNRTYSHMFIILFPVWAEIE